MTKGLGHFVNRANHAVAEFAQLLGADPPSTTLFEFLSRLRAPAVQSLAEHGDSCGTKRRLVAASRDMRSFQFREDSFFLKQDGLAEFCAPSPNNPGAVH